MPTTTARVARKISVSISVEIDPQAWLDDYGVDAAELRPSVKAYVLNLIQECGAAAEGAITAATLR